MIQDIVNDLPAIEVSGEIPKKVANPFAEVFLDQMNVAGQDVPKMAVMLKGEQAPVFVASHSPGYRLVSNEFCHQVLQDVVTRSDLGSPEEIGIIWTGKRYIERVILPGCGFQVNGSKMVLGLQGINSYDGSTSFGVEFFSVSLRCHNQFHFSRQLGSFIFKHVNGNNDIIMEDAIQQLRDGAQRFVKLSPSLGELNAQPASLDTLLQWHSDLSVLKPCWPTTKTGEVLLAMKKEKPTLWGLLNAFTWTTTHSIGGISGSRLSALACDYALKQIGQDGELDRGDTEWMNRHNEEIAASVN